MEPEDSRMNKTSEYEFQTPLSAEPDPGLTVEQMVERVQQGEVQTYTLIIRTFQRQIYLYCYYLLGNREEAEDAAQDIFIKALERVSQYSVQASFPAWLYRIAHNHCLDRIKQRNRGFRLLSLYKKQQQQAEAAGTQESRYTEVVHGLLEQLSLEERQILLLRALEEHSYEEIGTIMDMNPATVRKKYERLRKKLGRGRNAERMITHESR
ncbi:RNA polymerase sigma factor [Paenibacillus sp. MMS20-IR301]|uniref:RNA polymerase sigma factor n=1 Tax=Paenibacillus sp. MMS20-IR301 TaxID=2895946 RepID=UPI0028E8FDF6|nr:RNA polymerase sigma factor [Paenibacillus sp. MMS20-IR301]WNS47020.1 RNA polymerase sigma factor [Paenibacillus sp. MMS20-IR301]